MVQLIDPSIPNGIVQKRSLIDLSRPKQILPNGTKERIGSINVFPIIIGGTLNCQKIRT